MQKWSRLIEHVIIDIIIIIIIIFFIIIISNTNKIDSICMHTTHASLMHEYMHYIKASYHIISYSTWCN